MLPTPALVSVTGRARHALCLVRPPGHHAGVRGLTPGSVSCGFCVFNSVMVGAAHALQSAALRQVFYLELKLEVSEVERLVLEAPILLSKRINATFHSRRDGRRGSILGATKREPGVLRRRSAAVSAGEGDASVTVRGVDLGAVLVSRRSESSSL